MNCPSEYAAQRPCFLSSALSRSLGTLVLILCLAPQRHSQNQTPANVDQLRAEAAALRSEYASKIAFLVQKLAAVQAANRRYSQMGSGHSSVSCGPERKAA